MKSVAVLRTPRAGAVEMPPRGKRGKLKKAKTSFPLFPPGLEIRHKAAGFPHFHSAGGGLNFEERKSEKMKRKPNSS
jgi:hypothetical protein